MRPIIEQVGGNHYGTGYKHWDYCLDAHVDYLEGCATKYIARWRQKGGVEDLKKALSYVEKRLSTLDDKSYRVDNSHRHSVNWQKFIDDQGIKAPDSVVLYLIFNWTNKQALNAAKVGIEKLIADELRSVPTSDYTNQG